MRRLVIAPLIALAVGLAVPATPAEGQLFRLEGGGQTWPSGGQYLPVSLIGRVTREIDGADEVWSFFSRFEAAAEGRG